MLESTIREFNLSVNPKTAKIDSFSMPNKQEELENIVNLSNGEIFFITTEEVDDSILLEGGEYNPITIQYIKLYKLPNLDTAIWEFVNDHYYSFEMDNNPQQFKNNFSLNFWDEAGNEPVGGNFSYHYKLGIVKEELKFTNQYTNYELLNGSSNLRVINNLLPAHSILKAKNLLTKQISHCLFTNKFTYETDIKSLQNGFLIQGEFEQLNNVQTPTATAFVPYDMLFYNELKSDIHLNFGEDAAILLADDYSAIQIINMHGFETCTVTLANEKNEAIWTLEHEARTLFYKELGQLPNGVYTIKLSVTSYVASDKPYIYTTTFTKK